MHYISIYLAEIMAYFKTFNLMEFDDNDVWLECEEVPIVWLLFFTMINTYFFIRNIPFGVFFDIYFDRFKQLPLEVKLHTKYEKEMCK